MIDIIEIKQIAKKSWMCKDISLSHFLNNGNDLKMTHFSMFLQFDYTDNSKPYQYNEVVFSEDGKTAEAVSKIFTDKYKRISYEYPYYESSYPARLIEDVVGVFGTGNYTFTEKGTERKPDYMEVERMIQKAIKFFKDYEPHSN